ncbi:MAG: serine hydrolase [Pseudomonadota bacterium]
MLKKILLAVTALLVAGIAYVYLAYGSIARAGSGYAAKIICSGYFLSGFSPEIMKFEALAGASSTLANVSHEIDIETSTVTTKLYGLFKRRAGYTPGIGCTLLPSGEKELPNKITPLPDLTISDDLPWPQGSATPDVMTRFDTLLDEAFAETDPSAPRNTKAIVLIHKGKLIAEKYAEGVKPDTPLIGWSMAKSVTALTAGVAVKDGKIVPAEPAPVPLWQEKPDDPRAAITFDQLLRMSSGLEFNETYSSATDVTQMLSNETDMPVYAAGKPLLGPPDTIWSYSSGTTNIVSGIIKRSVGGSLQDHYEFTQQRLFRPLNISTATFEADASGTFIGSSYLYASARDWARLGQFCLQDGAWNGEQILPEGWMSYLVTPSETTPANQYGAHFWLNRASDTPSEDRIYPNLPEDAYHMGGFQGQRVLVIPSEDLVIARFGFTPERNHGVGDLAEAVIAELKSEI